MKPQIELTQDEWELVLDLLENERVALPPEIRHTDRQDLHHALQERLKMVTHLADLIRDSLKTPVA